MRRSPIALTALLATLALAAPALATLTYAPALPNVDQAVTFAATVSFGDGIDPATVTWRFGDGAIATGQVTVQHIYARAGTFTVQCRYFHVITFPGGVWMDEEITVVVTENRRVTASPASTQINLPVQLEAVNFLSSSVRWDFGDGSTPVVGGTAVSHAFAEPGVFRVAARDKGGAGLVDITAMVTVAVDISRRSITYAPAMPSPGLPVTFTAVAFYTNKIRWDFGDGTPAVSGGPTAAHTFAQKGLYAVRAWDWDGTAGGPTTVNVRVEEAVGPRAAFGIFYLQLRFEDGLAYKVVPRGYAGLVAYADLKYEGAGNLQAQWLVDGMPFQTMSRTLPFAEAATFDSGRVPALPTQMTGMHEVSLRLLSPTTSLTMPFIRYFVTAETGLPPTQGLSLQVAAVEGLKGVAGEMRLDSLRIPAGTYFILNGSVTYSQPNPVRFGLLRVHLGDDLVDQQILRDLRPGEMRPITTSIFNPSPEGKFLYLTLYDISDPSSPRLLYLKKMSVLPRD